jgi:hypothetical protein
MSMTDRTAATTTEVHGNTSGSYRYDHPHRETRLFARTSEFWAMLIGVAAIIVVYNVADDATFDLWRACLLGTILAVAYIVSRGIAKAGSHHDDGARASTYRR